MHLQQYAFSTGLPSTWQTSSHFPLLLGVGVAFNIYYIMAWKAGKTGLLQIMADQESAGDAPNFGHVTEKVEGQDQDQRSISGRQRAMGIEKRTTRAGGKRPDTKDQDRGLEPIRLSRVESFAPGKPPTYPESQPLPREVGRPQRPSRRSGSP